MIDTKELKRGNYVITDSGIVIEVNEISDNSINKTAIGRTEDIFINPIPITEDLLSDLGFDEEVDDTINRKYYRLRLNGFCIDINKYSNTLGRDYGIHIDNLCCDSVLSGDIQYLHQLQNYIYDSTHQELDVSMLLKK